MLPWQPEFQSYLPKTICNFSYYTVMLCVYLIKIPLLVLEIIDVLMFSHSKSMETIDPRGEAKFDPRGMNGINYLKRTISHCHIPNIKAVGLVVSEKIFFLVFPIVSL